MALELNCKTALDKAQKVGEGKHILFHLVGKSASGKTNIYWVTNKDTQEVIGQINWYSAWRQYSFFPQDNCVFEKTCLRDIANFCEAQTKQHHKSFQVINKKEAVS